MQERFGCRFTLPIAILIAFLVMRLQGLNANICHLAASLLPSAQWSMQQSL